MDTSIRKTCRICLRQYESRKDLISLDSFDQTLPFSGKIRFYDMLSNILNKTISQSDELPSKICIMCVSNLKVSYFFRLEVEKSEEVLIKRLRPLEGLQITIKEEARESNKFPVILSPRHVGHETFNEIQMESDDQIIDYEPDLDSVMEEDLNESGMNSSKTSYQNDPTNSHNDKLDSSNVSVVSANSKGDFSCTLCSKEFNSLKALHCHKRCIHSVKNCKYCQKKFGNKNQLKLHTKFKHADKYNEFLADCQKVDEKSKDPVVMIERLDNFNECLTCELKFANKISLVRHHIECRSDHKCIDCSLKIPRKDFYFKHLETVHNYSSIDLAGYECPFCMNLFRTEKVLQEHIQRLHPDENQSNADTFSEAGESAVTDEITLHQCKICSQSFQSSKSLKQHTTLKHKERDSISSLGSEKKDFNSVQTYSKEGFFERYIVKKNADFYRCIPCQKDIFKSSLILHIKSKHTAVRCFRCELCTEAFLRHDYRQKHVANIHPNDFKCFECKVQYDRAYKYEAHMTKHGRTQTIFKPDEGKDRYDLSHLDIKYIEDASNYDYSKDDQLINNDIRIVQNVETPLPKDEFCEKYMISVSDKNIKCNICNVEMQKASIMSHLLWKHAFNKPLKCSFCNERVVKNNARLAHMARCHPNEYKCDECNQQFVKHYLYVHHFKEVHQKKVTTVPSSGEEDDILNNDMRFVAHRNEDEVIEETDSINNIDDTVTVEKLFGCQFCPKKFTSSKNLLIHKSHKHKNETVEVPLQQETPIDEPMGFEEFKQNWVEILNNNDLKCLVCELVMRIKSFGPHVKAKHCLDGAYLCALCPERFHKLDHRIQHMSNDHKGIFYCTSCNIQFYCNSRYAKHMKELHEIELDNTDSYEVDLHLSALKFVPFVRTIPDDEISLQSSIQEPEVTDPMEEMLQLMTTSEEMSRSDFMNKYIQVNGQDRYCKACNKTFFHSSIYHHLIHFHSNILPFKCPFCDVRFERSVQRSKHLQVYHPDEYKCNECGLQFQKHIKFSEHMSIEHNMDVSDQKSPFEEDDLSSLELRYVANKSTDETFWQEDEGSIANSTTFSIEYQDEAKNDESTMMSIKTDQPEKTAISFVEDDNLVEMPPQIPHTTQQTFEDESTYTEYKSKYMKKVDGGNFKCIPCNKMIMRTSLCAHLRLWHSTSMIYNCELCPSGFRRGDYRMRHMGLHHPEAYKCSECNIQFYFSGLYKDHMMTEHKKSINVPMLKRKDEIDVPLENMLFAPYIPADIRLHNPDETCAFRRRASICTERPSTINSASTSSAITSSNIKEGMTYKEFLHKHVEVKNGISRCKPCSQEFSKLSIKKHIKRAHSTSMPYYCQLCEKGFYRIDDRLNHMKKNHPDTFKCLICDIQFYLSTNYIDHMATEHNMTVNISSNKSKEDVDIPFENLRFLAKNRNGSQNNSEINGTVDDGSLSRDEFSNRFITKFYENGELQMKCSACTKSFSAKHKRFHLLHNHCLLKPFGCDLCSTRFMSNFKRVKHMAFHHPNDFKCQICNVQYEKAESYGLHMKQEHKIAIKINSKPNIDINGEDMRYFEKVPSKRPAQKLNSSNNNLTENLAESDNSLFNQLESLHCDICNVDFDSSRSYRQHMRDHVGGIDPVVEKTIVKVESTEKVFKCDLCDKKLSTILARNAHKKFKHGVYGEGGGKQKAPNQKFEVVCEICEFTSFRRDYLEHHIKNMHGSEFSCNHCSRILSSYNYLIYHVQTNHYTKVDTSKYFKCSDCKSSFKLEENLQKHKESKHGDNPPQRNHFCELCFMDFRSPSHLTTHLETYTHKNMVNFFNGNTSTEVNIVKNEPAERQTIENDNYHVLQHKNDEPNVSERNRNDDENGEPLPKRLKVSTEDPDKLEYLKYLEATESGNFKCGICGKIKTLRKYMLHHLKQHKEIPTYDCDKCPERFVFKSKYDRHLEIHENGISSNLNDTVIENEHPKFQEIKKGPSEVRCTICNLAFKLTIILNKHNTTWHSISNPLRHLTMNEQKQKKSSDTENKNSVIKFLRCERCDEAFTKADDLEKHIQDVHNNEEDENESQEDEITEGSKKYGCDKCPLKFQDKKFLENHQNFFCVHRNQAKSLESTTDNEL